MLQKARSYLEAKYEALTSLFASRKPHFNFITAHYFWIIGATIIASVIIYGAGRGELRYIDALLFASGVNTQAGLNPVDVNKLNLAQQITMYIFPMLSNPITLHGSVVLLRLYWFEKRFQSVVRDARQRRTTLSKSRSKARGDVEGAREGVNGRDITVVSPISGRPPRVTNDGLVLHDAGHGEQSRKNQNGSEGSDTAVTDQEPGQEMDPAEGKQPSRGAMGNDDTAPNKSQGEGAQQPHDHHGPTITFADTVKRSDGVEDDPINFIRRRSNTEHIAILERQRNQDNEVLRIPGPRDAERGLGPRRLNEEDEHEDGQTLFVPRTRESRPDQATADSRNMPRNPTITIEEPSHPKLVQELSDDARVFGSTLEALRFRRPRFLNRDQHKLHEDNEPPRAPRAGRAKTLETLRSALTRDKADDMPYLSYTPTMGRNSNFVGLTLEQREELGGIEYRSLRTLALILLGYFWGFQLLALAFLLPYIIAKNYYGEIVTRSGVSRTWWGFWTANLSFMDVGFTLTPDSMISFQTSQYVLMVMWWFIIIGNTGFPVMLRFIIWVMSKLVPKGSGIWEELQFLLDHPRRCFTLLFPSGANWWLFWILVILNVLDLVFFFVLDLHSAVVDKLSGGSRVVNGLFQAASTRTAGFVSLPLAELHPAIPVLYMLMMYISVFPIAISIRRTNVYEERSLGVYHAKKDDDDDDDDETDLNANPVSYVSNHLRRQLSFDLWYVFLGFFILAITEGGKLKRKEFGLFDILFEIVSAYGTVGMSLGVPNVDASLCSQFSTIGKLVIIAMEIRGRHRGLPYGLDRAVILPSESRFKQETEEAQPPFIRSNTANSTAMSGAQRRGSSAHRGRSLSRDHDHKIISRFLHPGPVVPPSIVHTHHRTKSSGSDALSRVFSFGSRRPQSFHTAVVDDEEEGENADGLAPLPSNESRPQHPRRTESTPHMSTIEWG